MPNEVYLSEDETCRGLLTRESALILNLRPSKLFRMREVNKRIISYVYLDKHSELKVQMPHWTQGIWLSIGMDRLNTQTFYINQSQLVMKINNDQLVKYNLKFLRILNNQRLNVKTIHILAKPLQQW